MAKLKVKAKEIFNGDVRWISLVKRGANRLPIKIIKSEEDESMNIDLGSVLFRKRDGEAAVPASESVDVAAVVIRKGDDMDKLVAAVKDLGLAVDDTQEDDDALILKQAGWEDDEASMVPLRLNEDIGLILGGNAKKFFDPFSDSMSFIENVGAKGFFPGVQMANEALISTTMGIMRNSEDRKDAVSMIEKALDDHKAFVMGLTKSLPKVAFKLEELDRLSLAEKEETSADRSAQEGVDLQGCPPGHERDAAGNCVESPAADQGHGVIEAGAGTEVTTGDDGSAIGAVKAVHPGGCPEGQHRVDGRCVPNKAAAKSPGNPDENNANLSGARDCPEGQHLVDGQCVPLEVGATTQPPPPVGTGAGQLGAETGEMLKALKKITDSMGALMEKLTGQEKKLEATQDRLKSVEQASKAATDAVKGTALVGVVTEPEDLDGMRADHTRKDEGTVRKGFWDCQMDKMFNPEFTADLRE